MLPDVEEQCSWGKPETAPSLFVKAKKDFHLLPLHNFTDCSRPGGEGGTSQRFRWGCAARFWKPLPYLRPKYVTFPTLFILFYFRPDPKFDTLFQTRPKPYFVCVNI